MSLRVSLCLCLLAIAVGTTGCSMPGVYGKQRAIANDQWEPEVEATANSDWRSAPSNLRQGAARKSTEDPLDKLIWSDESRDINRSLGGAL